MKHTKSSLFALLACGLLAVASCKKDKNASSTTADTDTEYAQEHATLERSFDESQNLVDVSANPQADLSAMMKTTAGATPLSGCATVTRDTLSNPRVLTIDFGTTNCLCQDGIYRRGKIICTYTGAFRTTGGMRTITYDNFFRNDNQLNGIRKVTNMGPNAQGEYYFSVSDVDTVVRANSGGTLTRSSQRTRTWKQGYSTPAISDDVFEVTGSGTITRANGKTFQVAITTPLQIAAACRWIQAGVLTITPQNGAAVRTLDYGNGTCDALAQLTINGTVHNITLR